MKNDMTVDMHELLRKAVEKSAGRKMMTPRDFDFLSMRIFDTTHSHMSPTTLKRFWGYLNNGTNYQPRRVTLDLLSMYVGYKDWDSYCKSSSACRGVNSDFVKSPTIYATSLALGEKLNLLWDPDRCVTVKYMGEDMFEVVKSVNSKLEIGDRFCCGCFMEGESLYLSRLVRKGQVLGGYMCGQDGGIKCDKLSDVASRGGVNPCKPIYCVLCLISLRKIAERGCALIGLSPWHRMEARVSVT